MTDRFMIFVTASYLSQTNCKPLESNMMVNVMCSSDLSFLCKIVDVAVVSPGSKNNAQFS